MRATKLFLSYRRADNPYAAGRLYDHLVDAFGEDAVYFDVASLYGGIDFRKLIDYKIAECDAVIVVIGDKWLALEDDKGNRRIDQPNDIVHIEIRSALDRGVPLTPIFVDNGKIPKDSELPEVLRDLCYRNGYEAGFESFRTQVKNTIIPAIRNGIELHREMFAASQHPERQLAVIEEAPSEILDAIDSAGPVEAVTTAGQDIEVFISYSHLDDEPLLADEKGWVTSFCQVLQIMLGQLLGRQALIWFNREISGSDLFAESNERLEKAAAVVAMITPRYLNSEFCIHELETFKPTISDGRMNLFPVYRFPIFNRDALPAVAKRVLGYEFFTYEEGTPIPLEANTTRFRSLIYRLARDIADTIGGK